MFWVVIEFKIILIDKTLAKTYETNALLNKRVLRQSLRDKFFTFIL